MINTLYYETRLGTLEQEIKELEQQLKSFPKGLLVIYKTKNGNRWIRQTKDVHGKPIRSYISKKNKDLAEQLAKKALKKAILADKKNEYLAVKRFLEIRRKCKVNKMLSDDSHYLPLLSPYLECYFEKDYPKNPYKPEALVVEAPKGEFVRSKSEAIIAYSLFSNNIEYCYEYPLTIDDAIIYPDFTIIHPKTKRKIIWEHFGLADSPSYQVKMLNKIRNYINAGYIPGKNLIMTFETGAAPISIEYIQSLIDIHFEKM